MVKQRKTNKQRFAETACDGFNGYHNTKDASRAVESWLTGNTPAGSSLLEEYVANELKKAYSGNASYEENCERAYRQINDAVRRLRRVRDAFGRTIGKCR